MKIYLPFTLAKSSFAKSNNPKAFLSLSILMATSFFASLNASMTITFKEFADTSNDYGGSGVEISWTGSFDVSSVPNENRQDTLSGRYFLRSAEGDTQDGLNDHKFMILAPGAAGGFTQWRTTDIVSSDAADGAFMPDPIFDPNGGPVMSHFANVPGGDPSSSADYIAIGDPMGMGQRIYEDGRVTSYFVTPLNYQTGSLIVGTAFMRDLTFTDLHLPSLESLLDANEIFEISTQIGFDTITYRVVPEPSTYGLIFGGIMLGVIGLRLRKRSS